MDENSSQGRIPERLNEKQFHEFIFPHLPKTSRGPAKKVADFKIFNYIMYVLYTGCQWKSLQSAIDKGSDGKAEIHYTNVFRTFQRWQKSGSLKAIFMGTVLKLFESGQIDSSVLHGDGTSTIAKKGEII